MGRGPCILIFYDLIYQFINLPHIKVDQYAYTKDNGKKIINN